MSVLKQLTREQRAEIWALVSAGYFASFGAGASLVLIFWFCWLSRFDMASCLKWAH